MLGRWRRSGVAASLMSTNPCEGGYLTFYFTGQQEARAWLSARAESRFGGSGMEKCRGWIAGLRKGRSSLDIYGTG